MSKKFLPITILTSLTPFSMASAETENPIGYQNGFANISLNYFDWSQWAENKSAHSTGKKDFAYLELEEGANFNWGELYGFLDVENQFHQRKTEPSRNQRYAVKTTSRVYLGNSGYVIGWVACYSFQLWSQNFSITNWHEMEFNRAKCYGNVGKKVLTALSPYGGHHLQPYLLVFNIVMPITSLVMIFIMMASFIPSNIIFDHGNQRKPSYLKIRANF